MLYFREKVKVWLGSECASAQKFCTRLLNYVSYMLSCHTCYESYVLPCLTCLVSYVPLRLTCLVPYMPSWLVCSCFSRALCPTCSRAPHASSSMCSRALRAYSTSRPAFFKLLFISNSQVFWGNVLLLK